MKILHYSQLGLAISCLTLSGCEKKAEPAKPAPNKDAPASAEVSTLRGELSKTNGSVAYSKLHHLGQPGFDALLAAFAAGEITPDNYISWEYDLQTRWDDGSKLMEEFQKYEFEKAEHDDKLAEKLARFYGEFPPDFLDELKKRGPGAEKIAKLASEKK